MKAETMTRNYHALLGAITLTILAAISTATCGGRGVKGQGIPVLGIRSTTSYEPTLLSIELAPGVELSGIISTEVFRNLRPDIDASVAQTLAKAAPTRATAPRDFEFRFADATIRLKDEALEVHPQPPGAPLDSLFKHGLERQLSLNRYDLIVVNGFTSHLMIDQAGGRVTKIRWF